MKRVTMKTVNEMAKKYNCTFHKGKGYFYFNHKDYRKTFYSGSVYVYRLNDLSIERWEQELNDKINGGRY